MVLNDTVYDITMYLKYHPGGIETILERARTDATDLFSLSVFKIFFNYFYFLKKFKFKIFDV